MNKDKTPTTRFGVSTNIGGKKINQDSHCEERLFSIPFPCIADIEEPVSGTAKLACEMFGVFDGHGEHGHFAAKYVAENLPKMIANDLLSRISPGILKSAVDTPIEIEKESMSNLAELTSKTPEEARKFLFDQTEDSLKKLFPLIDDMLMENKEIDTYISGTTGTILLVFIQDFNGILFQHAVIGHAGDCRIIVLTTEGDLLKEYSTETRYSVSQATADHSVENIQEKKRLSESGATIEKLLRDGERTGPLRVFKGSLPYPGLAVARTFGDDIAKKLGVIPDPQVKHVYLPSGTTELPIRHYMVLACDGVWDGLSNMQVAQILFKHRYKKRKGDDLLDDPSFSSLPATPSSPSAPATPNLGVLTPSKGQPVEDPQRASTAITKSSLKALDQLQLDDNVTNICIFFP